MLKKLIEIIRTFKNRKWNKLHLQNLQELSFNREELHNLLKILRNQAEKMRIADQTYNSDIFFEAMNFIINPIRRIVFQKHDYPHVTYLSFCDNDSFEIEGLYNSQWRSEISKLEQIESELWRITYLETDKR